MTNLPALPENSILTAMTSEASPAERAKAVSQGMRLHQDPRFTRPVPLFMSALPYIGDDEEVQDRIAAQLFLADDPDAQSTDARTIAAKDFCGKAIVVNDIRTNEAAEKGRWGAYLLIDATIVDTGERQVFNTGAPQAIVRLAIAHARGEFPLKGAFAEVAGTGRGGNAVVTFIAEPDL